MKVTFGNETFELTPEQVERMKKALGVGTKRLSDIAIGETFKVADIEFIKFTEENGEAVAVARNILFKEKFGDDTNNFANSSLLEKLENEVLVKIEAAIGANNVLPFATYLTSLDGLNDYGETTSKISLPTFEFYRKHVKIFDKHNPNGWWWLSTPWSTPAHNYDYAVCCVDADGALDFSNCYNYRGVRPFLVFKSSIFVS